MSEALSQFHFLRPEWLYLVPLLALLLVLRRFSARSGWNQVIEPHLLRFMQLKTGIQHRAHSRLALVSALLAIVAAAGPAFRQQPVPLFQTEQARVVVLDLSLSMLAEDIQPSRLERARFKLLDILRASNEGSIALVVYAGDAFIISPLTEDANTIANMVPVLSPMIMPVLGSEPKRAFAQALKLLRNSKLKNGQIIWLTDGVEPQQTEEIIEMLRSSSVSLSILAIGSEEGAPIPLPNNKGFLKDDDGNIVVPRLDLGPLQSIQQASNARLSMISADSSDIEYLLHLNQWQGELDRGSESEQTVNRWHDDGYWLVWLVIALSAAAVWRNGALEIRSLLPFLFVGSIGTGFAPPASASIWDSLWLSSEQRAQKAFEAGDYDRAAELSEDPRWQAAARYRLGQFEQSASLLESAQTADDHYNRGNALAKAGRLEDAIKAYEQTLALDPTHEDARFNKKLVEDLLQQQQQQQQQQDMADQQQQQQSQQQQDGDNGQNQNDPQQQQQQSQQQSQEQQDSQQGQQQQSQQPVEAEQDERSEQEKDQALKHWMEKIPDDPGGLLRSKMYREYQKRGRQQRTKKVW